MTDTFTYDRCVELVPEWQGLELQIGVLTGGITNTLYRVELPDDRSYVVRVYGPQTELFIDREIEMENLRRMEVSGVAPRLVKYLPEEQVTITEFIPGTPLKNSDFVKDELLDLIVRPIRIIHSSGVRLPKTFDPLEEVKRLSDVLAQVRRGPSGFDIAGTIRVLERISALLNIPHAEYVPCHIDLLADNFILAAEGHGFPEPMYLIDWEYAGMSTPFYEIADMFQEVLVPRETEEKILRLYWRRRHIEEQVLKTDMFKPFPDMYWFLWSLIQLEISSIEFDYYTYGAVKFENAQQNIQMLRERYRLDI